MKQLLFLFTFICCILCKTYSQGNDVTFISGSAKPSFTDALEGLKSYNFQCISNGQEIGERASFIDAFFIEQMKIYMENICPDAIFGIDYKYPSCTHATIVAQYNHTTKMNWSGIWQWVVTNVRVTFRFGLSNQYIYTFTLPNFKQNGNDFSGGNVCNSLIKNVSQYRHRYNYNKVIKLQSYKTKWTESSLRQYYSTNADMVEGIYESTVSANDATHNKYKLGLKKMQDGNYALIYLGGANLFDDWKEGEIKAFLTPTGSTGVYKAKWLLSNKEITDDYYVILKTNSLSVKDTEENELYLKLYPRAEMLAKNKISSGTGFFLNKNGYIITNYHVIENAKTIKVSGINDNYKNSYTARVEISDKQNDLAILKITDKSFKPIANIPYTFKYTTSSVGEDCYVLGYPLISTMGMDIKLTNGIISSKTGYDGNIAQYQISAAVQPGNSGGPLFDKNGNIIGIVQAKHTQAENAGYAIKASYIRNLVELLPMSITMPRTNILAGKTLPKQVELASKAVCVIIVNDE